MPAPTVPPFRFPTEKERRVFFRGQDRDIKRLWAEPMFLRWRRELAKDRIHAWLRHLRDTDMPSFEAAYAGRLAWLAGVDGICDVAGSLQLAWQGASPPEARVNQVLERAHLFKRGARYDNQQYRLLLAHLLFCPDDIHEARNIPEPRPWPWVVHVQRQGNMLIPPFNVVRQADITSAMRKAADRLDQDFHDPGRLLSHAPYNTSDESVERREREEAAQRQFGKLAHEMQAHGDLRDEQILEHDTFLQALEEAKAGLPSQRTLAQWINAYRVSIKQPPRGRGRPPRR